MKPRPGPRRSGRHGLHRELSGAVLGMEGEPGAASPHRILPPQGLRTIVPHNYPMQCAAGVEPIAVAPTQATHKEMAAQLAVRLPQWRTVLSTGLPQAPAPPLSTADASKSAPSVNEAPCQAQQEEARDNPPAHTCRALSIAYPSRPSLLTTRASSRSRGAWRAATLIRRHAHLPPLGEPQALTIHSMIFLHASGSLSHHPTHCHTGAHVLLTHLTTFRSVSSSPITTAMHTSAKAFHVGPPLSKTAPKTYHAVGAAMHHAGKAVFTPEAN